MQIIGLGTDIVEIDRIKEVVSRHTEHFKNRVYTADELLCAEKKNDQIAYLAGRWAAKEAAAKALGCGIGSSCALNDIEIINDAAGQPQLSFYGDAANTAEKLGVNDIKLSISHEKHYAVATVILCNKDD